MTAIEKWVRKWFAVFNATGKYANHDITYWAEHQKEIDAHGWLSSYPNPPSRETLRPLVARARLLGIDIQNWDEDQ